MENSSARRPLKTRSSQWARTLALALASADISANQISVIGLGFGALGSLAMANAHNGSPWLWLVGAVSIQARLLCNMLDGLVAVEGGRKGRAGDLYNEVPDRIADILLFAGAGYGAGSPELGWVCATLAVLTAYVRAFGASLGKGQDFCGPGAKPHRMFALTLTCLASLLTGLEGANFLTPQLGLIVIAALTGATALRRVGRLYRQLAVGPTPKSADDFLPRR